MGMRAQVSLQFDDSDLYHNLVVPYKEQKVLNGTIIKCLTAYYYNEEVRRLVEGVSPEDVAAASEVDNRTQAILDEIHASLFLQNNCIEELEDTIAGGMEDLNTVLNQTSDTLNSRGWVKPQESEYGSGVGSVDKRFIKAIGMKSTSQEPAKEPVPLDKVDLLVEAVKLLAISVGNSEVASLLGGNQVSAPSPEPETETETSILKEESEAVLSAPEEEEDFDDVDVEESDFAPDEEETPQVTSPVIAGEAAEAMGNLLASL